MNVLGIIAEYNPFHNGHIYHIKKAKEMTNADYVILVMSGNFTQTGNIAVLNKFERAKIVCEYGINLVIELPTIYATSSAEYFATGAVNLLDKLGIVNYICFGTEEKDIENLKSIAKIIIDNEKNIYENIRIELKKGITFAKARQITISKYLPTNSEINYTDILSKPNNILGIEYLKALNKLNSTIIPYSLYRDTANHNDTKANDDSSITSATAIRNLLKVNDLENIRKYIPENMYNELIKSKICLNEDMYKLIKYKILTMDKEDLSQINEVTEGLENRIIEANLNSKSYEELVENIKSKRYVETKIRRILINILLGIKKDIFSEAISKNITYAHILSMNGNGKKLLSQISKKSNIELLASINNKLLENIDNKISYLLNLDILASNIHSSISNSDINLDFYNKLSDEKDTQ